MNNVKILTLKVGGLNQTIHFVGLTQLLLGQARLIQGDTNVSAKSLLGVLSLCGNTILEAKPFNMKFINCSDYEIEKFKEFLVDEVSSSEPEQFVQVTFDNKDDLKDNEKLWDFSIC